MPRVVVPRPMKRSLLRKNARMCCVCKARHVGLNFHHIDGDSSNTTESNLAVLCVRDHDAHHRPTDYRGGRGRRAETNHLDLDADAIRRAKTSWESFVTEVSRDAPSVLATITMYGNLDEVHSFKVAFQWATGRVVFERVYHLHDGPPPTLADRAVEEVVSLGRHIKIVMVNEPMSIEYCPCCEHSLSRTVSRGYARRLTSPTWSTASVGSVYINPHMPSVAFVVGDEQEQVFTASLHRCGAFLDLASDLYHERVPITRRPSVRAQASRIVRKLLRDWAPSRTYIGTGSPDEPTLIDDLRLPVCWERPSDGPRRKRRR